MRAARCAWRCALGVKLEPAPSTLVSVHPRAGQAQWQPALPRTRRLSFTGASPQFHLLLLNELLGTALEASLTCEKG